MLRALIKTVAAAAWLCQRIGLPVVIGYITAGIVIGPHTHLFALISDAGTPLVVCNEAQRFMVGDQLREIGHATGLILEIEGRNTAPAVGTGVGCPKPNDACARTSTATSAPGRAPNPSTTVL